MTTDAELPIAADVAVSEPNAFCALTDRAEATGAVVVWVVLSVEVPPSSAENELPIAAAVMATSWLTERISALSLARVSAQLPCVLLTALSLG